MAGFDNTIHSPLEFIKPAICLLLLFAAWLYVLIGLLTRGKWIGLAVLIALTAIAVVIFGVWVHAHYRWV